MSVQINSLIGLLILAADIWAIVSVVQSAAARPAAPATST